MKHLLVVSSLLIFLLTCGCEKVEKSPTVIEFTDEKEWLNDTQIRNVVFSDKWDGLDEAARKAALNTLSRDFKTTLSPADQAKFARMTRAEYATLILPLLLRKKNSHE